MQLFDSVVLPVLLYGCEIWGFENLAIIEKVHLQFLKYTLHLKNSTPLCMIYGELGRLPIECEIKKRMIKFWMRLIATNNNKLSNKIYQVLFNMHVANIYSSPWICVIENILNSCGFTYIWLQQCKQSDTWVDYILKQNIKDQFIPNVLTINCINRHLVLKNTLTFYRIQNILYL